jgi:hypothetical protein
VKNKCVYGEEVNILVVCSFLNSTKIIENLVQMSCFKFYVKMTVIEVLRFFNIEYDTKFQDLTLSGYTSAVCMAIILGFLMVQN